MQSVKHIEYQLVIGQLVYV